jgi:hypothetical protein
MSIIKVVILYKQRRNTTMTTFNIQGTPLKDSGRLVSSWLEDESGTYVTLSDFPFWIMCRTPTIGVFDEEVYADAKLPFGEQVRIKWAHTEPISFFAHSAKIDWANFWCRRGVVITDSTLDGAYLGFSTAGNGTDVYMTYIPKFAPEYLLYVLPILEMTVNAVLNRLNVNAKVETVA